MPVLLRRERRDHHPDQPSLASGALTGGSPTAVRDGCPLRFRAIMMTTMGALVRGLPLGISVGSELRRLLGIAIVVIVSRMLTLFTT